MEPAYLDTTVGGRTRGYFTDDACAGDGDTPMTYTLEISDELIRITVTVYRWFAGLSRRTTGDDL
jgi:hypothetical protein